MQGDWPTTDHDILIQVRTLVEVLREDVRALQQSVNSVQSSLGDRLTALEQQSVRYPAERYEQVAQEWQDFRARLRVYAALMGLATTVAASVLSRLLSEALR